MTAVIPHYTRGPANYQAAGLIYGGPMAVKKINRGIARLLARDGYAHVSDAVGKENS